MPVEEITPSPRHIFLSLWYTYLQTYFFNLHCQQHSFLKYNFAHIATLCLSPATQGHTHATSLPQFKNPSERAVIQHNPWNCVQLWTTIPILQHNESNCIYKCHFTRGCLGALCDPLTSSLPWLSHELVLFSQFHKHWISTICLPLLPHIFLYCGLGEERKKRRTRQEAKALPKVHREAAE